MAGSAAETPDNKTISIDATYLKAHRTVSSLSVKKGGRGRLITAWQGIAKQCPEREGAPKAV